MRIPDEKLTAAGEHFLASDPAMHGLMLRVGPCTLKLHRDRFDLLVRSIISQQISTKAARSIRLKLLADLQVQQLDPQVLIRASDAALRGAGLSGQKVAYIRDLADHVLSGRLPLNRLGRYSDAEAIDRLTEVHGIGKWTAQMFLIFALGRLDVFPEADLGLRSAMRELYELAETPGLKESRELAAHWSPFATLGTWYAWRLSDLKSDPGQAATVYPV